LLYPGKEHAVIGEMESGKSWLALACVAAEITKGNRVVYVHFEEADPTDTVERLQALGVPDVVILDLFTFVGPNEPVDPYALGALLDPGPSLVVLDGVNEAMSMHGQGIRDEDGVAAFRRRLVKPCTAVGAAVLACDHVVKDRERRGRDPLGSVHKGNGLTGSLILLENVAPFGRSARGCSHLFVTKDRPGHLRRHGRPSRLPGKTFIGTLVVDDPRMGALP
jgi:RecA-family ATPase